MLFPSERPDPGRGFGLSDTCSLRGGNVSPLPPQEVGRMWNSKQKQTGSDGKAELLLIHHLTPSFKQEFFFSPSQSDANCSDIGECNILFTQAINCININTYVGEVSTKCMHNDLLTCEQFHFCAERQRLLRGVILTLLTFCLLPLSTGQK